MSVDGMRERLERRRQGMSGSLWVWPAVATVIALLLGLVISQIDGSAIPWLRTWLYPGDATDARRLLITVAAALVGALALVIGLTMVAIQVAANRYSPRLLRSFLRDKSVKVTLALLVGSFTFNTAGLFTVGGPYGGADEYPRLAVTVGLVSLFACIAALIVFVDRMAHSIQIDSVLARIGRASVQTMRHLPPGVGAGCGRTPLDEPPSWATPVHAYAAGYVQRVRREQLRRFAEGGINVRIVVRVGDHVVPGMLLGWIWRTTPDDATSIDEENVRSALWIGQERTRNQDVALGIDQMVDIAMLSAHVYDFHTVVQSTHELATLLSQLVGVDLGDERIDVGAQSIGLRGREFGEYLERACGELRRRSMGEPVIYLALLSVLGSLALLPGRPDTRAAIEAEVALLLSSAGRTITEPEEFNRVDQAAQGVLDACRVD